MAEYPPFHSLRFEAPESPAASSSSPSNSRYGFMFPLFLLHFFQAADRVSCSHPIFHTSVIQMVLCRNRMRVYLTVCRHSQDTVCPDIRISFLHGSHEADRLRTGLGQLVDMSHIQAKTVQGGEVIQNAFSHRMGIACCRGGEQFIQDDQAPLRCLIQNGTNPEQFFLKPAGLRPDILFHGKMREDRITKEYTGFSSGNRASERGQKPVSY